ncbi:MAG: outer membrane beta-barrel domain-containing protein [Myxococcales bacterium]|nr:outer membrane beta-barrel domain-containing protein [Myxococcales bacterium]
MRLLLFLALLCASAAQALSAPRLLDLVLGQTDDEEEEEEEAPLKPKDQPPPKPGDKVAKPEEKPAPAAVPAAPQAPAGQQRLVSGAPLFNPNVAVHIVEKKIFSDNGKREVALYPLTIQANGKATQHIGTAATAVWHLHENFGFQVSGHYHWVTTESAFNQELIEKARREFQAATSLLLVWGVQGGVEVTPLYGKFAWYEDSLAHFSVVVNGGAGIGATRHQLKPAGDPTSEGGTGAATFGETGNKFLGSLGAGVRLQFGERFAFRAEIRDLVYTAKFDAVNGCDFGDLDAMDKAIRNGSSLDGVNVSPSCVALGKKVFAKVRDDGYKHTMDIPLAKNLVSTPSSDVLNNLGFYAGVSLLF